MAFGPAYGSGTGVGAIQIFIKSDGSPAIFADIAARDTYFADNPAELVKLRASGDAVGIGTADQITAAYIYQNSMWQPVATNFKGDKGDKGNTGATGQGIDPSLLVDSAIPVWDSTTQELKDSGIRSINAGEIMIAPASIDFGNHRQSSTVENVVFKNDISGKVYSPVWQEIGQGIDEAYLRAYESTIDSIVRVPLGSNDVTNPVITGLVVDANESFIGATAVFSQDATDVVFEARQAGTDKLIWRQRVGDRAAGEQSFDFEIPLDIRVGASYDISVSSENGSDVILKSNADTGFSWTIRRIKWSDSAVASQNWVTNWLNSLSFVSNVVVNGSILTVTLVDGTSTDYTLPAGSGGSGVITPEQLAAILSDIADLKTKDQDIEDDILLRDRIFTYTGVSPNYPSSLRGHYYILATPDSAGVSFTAPSYSGSVEPRDGTEFLVRNSSGDYPITINQGPDNASLNGQTTIDLDVYGIALFIRKGNDWKLVFRGYLPHTRQELMDHVATRFANELHTLDEIEAAMINRGFIKNTNPGTTHSIYQGFTLTNTPDEATVKADGTSEEVTNLNNHALTFTRKDPTDTTQKYTFLWIPDALGNLVAVNYGGFDDYWTTTALTVDGVAGKLSVSDNTTAGNNVQVTLVA